MYRHRLPTLGSMAARSAAIDSLGFKKARITVRQSLLQNKVSFTYYGAIAISKSQKISPSLLE